MTLISVGAGRCGIALFGTVLTWISLAIVAPFEHHVGHARIRQIQLGNK